MLFGCRALLVWWEEEALFVECSAVFPLPSPLYFPLFISVMGACLLGGMGLMAGLSGFAQSPFWNWLPIVEVLCRVS